jgi:tetratricopeptide (TPR) repeat protein
LSDGRVLAWETGSPPVPQTLASGFWQIKGQELVQELPTGGSLHFGDPGWVDYDMEAEVLLSKTGKVGVYCRDRLEVLLDGSVPNGSGIWEHRKLSGPGMATPHYEQWAAGFPKPPRPGDWYRIKAAVRGPRITMFVNDTPVCEHRADVPGIAFLDRGVDYKARGGVGLLATGTAARFRKVRVTHTYGVILHEGLPALPPPHPSQQAAYHMHRGKGLLEEGNLDEALAEFLLAIKATPAPVNPVEAHTQVGLILRRQGKREEAIGHLRQAASSIQPGAVVSSLEALAHSQASKALNELLREQFREKLADYVNGALKPASMADTILLANLCMEEEYPLAAARFFRAVYKTGRVQVNAEKEAQEFFHAMQAAARAGSRLGKDAVHGTEEERKVCREQAREWLQSWMQNRIPTANWVGVNYLPARRMLLPLQRDPSFAAYRDEAGRAQLPADERDAWRALWAELDSFLHRTAALSYGPWTIAQETLFHEPIYDEGLLLLGDPSWTDYNLEVDTAVGGEEGRLGMLVRAQAEDDALLIVLGGKANTTDGVMAYKPGKATEPLGQKTPGPLMPGKWYHLRIEARGSEFKVTLDDKVVQQFQDKRFPAGRVGLHTWHTSARFQKLKVTDSSGKVLLERMTFPPPSITVATLSRLLDWESGKLKLDKPADLLALARAAHHDCKRYDLATRLFTAYLQKEPVPKDLSGASSMYSAACSAACAGTDKKIAVNQLALPHLVAFRRQALDWLRQELNRYQVAFKDRPQEVSGWLRDALRRLQHDPDLVGVRDPAALQSLPPNERPAWTKLWADVAALLGQADNVSR